MYNKLYWENVPVDTKYRGYTAYALVVNTGKSAFSCPDGTCKTVVEMQKKNESIFLQF